MPDASILEPLGSLIGIVIVVWFFLNYITKEGKTHTEHLKEISTTNRAESQSRKDEMMKHLDKNTEVISENTKQSGETSTVLGQTNDILRRIHDGR